MKKHLVWLVLAIAAHAQVNPVTTGQITMPVFTLNPAPATGATIGSVGLTGSRTIYYWIAVNYQVGQSNLAGPFNSYNAPSTLTGSNYVTINPDIPAGASSYDVLKTLNAIMPTGACACAVATGVSPGTITNDQTNSTSSYTINPFNLSSLNLTLANEVQSAGVSHLILRQGNGTFITDLSVGGSGGTGTVTSVSAGTGLTGGPITTSGTISLTVPVSIVNGGTGTTTPGIVAGTNITVSGSWPNQTINSTASGTGTVTSVATTGPITGGPITGSGTIACATCGVTGSGLNQFAATTSAQLAGVVSNETGSSGGGILVFNNSPTFQGTVNLGTGGIAAASNSIVLNGSGISATDAFTNTLLMNTSGFALAYHGGGAGDGALTLSSGSGGGAQLTDGNGNSLILGNSAGSRPWGINLTNTNVSAGFVNSTSTTSYLYGSPLTIGVNSTPGSLGSLTAGVTISTTGSVFTGNLSVSGISSSTSPICPNGTGGAFTTVGCTGGGGGSGTINSAVQYSTPVYSSSGSAQVLSGVPAPTSPNGVAQIWTSTPAGGVGTQGGWAIPGIPVDAQTGTSYAIPVTDNVSLITSTNSSPVAWAGFALANNYTFAAWNLGAGTITYTPASGTVTPGPPGPGASTIIPSGWFALQYTDNTKTLMPIMPTITDFPDCHTAGSSALIFTAATGAFACNSISGGGGGGAFPQTVSGTVTSGGIPYFNTSTQMSSSALLVQYGVVLGGGVGGAPVSTAQGASNSPLIGQGAANPIFSTIGYPTSAVSGGVICATSTTTLASSAIMTNNAAMFGGGAGSCPTVATAITFVNPTLTVAPSQTSGTAAALAITPLWNNGASVFDAALLVNPTNTASGAGALLIDAQLSGTSEWKVDKTGKVTESGSFNIGATTTAGIADVNLATNETSGTYMLDLVDQAASPAITHFLLSEYPTNFLGTINHSYVMGPNLGIGGGKYNNAQPAWGDAWEGPYNLNGTQINMERHWWVDGISTSELRPITAAWDQTTGVSQFFTMRSDVGINLQCLTGVGCTSSPVTGVTAAWSSAAGGTFTFTKPAAGTWGFDFTPAVGYVLITGCTPSAYNGPVAPGEIIAAGGTGQTTFTITGVGSNPGSSATGCVVQGGSQNTYITFSPSSGTGITTGGDIGAAFGGGVQIGVSGDSSGFLTLVPNTIGGTTHNLNTRMYNSGASGACTSGDVAWGPSSAYIAAECLGGNWQPIGIGSVANTLKISINPVDTGTQPDLDFKPGSQSGIEVYSDYSSSSNNCGFLQSGLGAASANFFAVGFQRGTCTSLTTFILGGYTGVTASLRGGATEGIGIDTSGNPNLENTVKFHGTSGVSVGPITALTSVTTVAGGVTALSGTSDQRLKDGVDFTGGLDLLAQIHPKEFHYNAKGVTQTGIPAERVNVGFFAQDVCAVIPAACPTTEPSKTPGDVDAFGQATQYLDFDPRPVIALLVNSVKEQQKEIERLKAQMEHGAGTDVTIELPPGGIAPEASQR